MDLENYYKINFALLQYHKYSLTEIENLIPWERGGHLFCFFKKKFWDEKKKKKKKKKLMEEKKKKLRI